MVTLENVPEEVEKVLKGTRYPHLRLLSGGGNPPKSGGINWLNGLDKGTAFTCKKKGEEIYLKVYIIAFKYERSIVLVDAFNPSDRFGVDPAEWSKKYSYWETIGKEEAELQPEGVEDGNNQGALQPRIVEDDADAT